MSCVPRGRGPSIQRQVGVLINIERASFQLMEMHFANCAGRCIGKMGRENRLTNYVNVLVVLERDRLKNGP